MFMVIDRAGTYGPCQYASRKGERGGKRRGKRRGVGPSQTPLSTLRAPRNLARQRSQLDDHVTTARRSTTSYSSTGPARALSLPRHSHDLASNGHPKSLWVCMRPMLCFKLAASNDGTTSRAFSHFRMPCIVAGRVRKGCAVPSAVRYLNRRK